MPTPYPDELWYSVLCRYHIRSGNQCAKHSVIDIFGHHKQKVSVELATDLGRTLDALRAPFMMPIEILTNHTLLPYYARFWGSERKRAMVSILTNGGGNDIHRVGIFQSSAAEHKPTFRYCPKCFEEDVSRYGEPYWHRQHQLSDLRVCVRHGCWLADTGLTMRDYNRILTPALPGMQLITLEPGEPTAQELKLSKLYADNLLKPWNLDANGRVYVDAFDYELKRWGWRSPTGKNTRTKAISAAMRGFYGPFVTEEDLSVDKLNSTFAATKSPAPRYVLQAAFFLGLDVESILTKPPKVDAVAEIHRLLAAGVSQRETARRIGVDASTVRRWSRSA